MLAGMPQAPSPVFAGAEPAGHEGAPQRGAGQDGRARLHHAREGRAREAQGPRPEHEGLLPEGARALRARLRAVRADQGVRRRDRQARRASRSTRRSTSRSSRRRARRSPTAWATSARRRRSSRSDPSNGDIVAMASSQEYGKSKFNLAAQGHRQPGSSFKIMTLLTALRLGVDPNSTTYGSRGHDDARRPAVRLPGVALAGQDLRRHRRRQHEPRARDAGLRQLRLRAARLRPRPGQGQGDGADDGHQVQAQRLLRRDARRPRGRRLAAGDGQRVRHDRQRRLPQPAARDQEDHPRGQDARSSRSAGACTA